MHSDLSAYNILVWEDEIFIIDLPQAVDIRQSPNVEKLLRRDIIMWLVILRSTLRLMLRRFMLLLVCKPYD